MGSIPVPSLSLSKGTHVKKFQVKLVAEKFITVACENEDELLKKLEKMESSEMRNFAGYPEWNAENLDEMPKEMEVELVLQDDRFWASN